MIIRLKKQGFTLIELLVSLVILSSIMIVIAMLSRLALRDLPSRQARLQWLNAADATLRIIEHDLLARDIEYDRQMQQIKRVHVEDGVLVIQTRSGAGVTTTHRYTMDNGQLVLLVSPSSDGQRQVPRVLLGDLAETVFAVDESAHSLRCSFTPINGHVYEQEVVW